MALKVWVYLLQLLLQTATWMLLILKQWIKIPVRAWADADVTIGDISNFTIYGKILYWIFYSDVTDSNQVPTTP